MICTRIGRPADKPSTTLGFRVFPVRREWSAMEEFYKPGRPVWRKRNAEHRPEAHRKYVSSLIKTLEELEEKTRPNGGAETELGKDLAAFQALKFARYLVDAVAGWALDHQIGLALSRLEFPGSDAFMVAYRTALAGTASEIKPTSRASKGTFNHLAHPATASTK